MISIGHFPYLECSSRGDKRFSAFYAKVDGKSIEETYQAAKIFENGVTGLSWRDAKGKKALNMSQVAKLYKDLWRRYLVAHPSYLKVLKKASGLSDMFGQEGHICQAVTLWELRNEMEVE